MVSPIDKIVNRVETSPIDKIVNRVETSPIDKLVNRDWSQFTCTFAYVAWGETVDKLVNRDRSRYTYRQTSKQKPITVHLYSTCTYEAWENCRQTTVHRDCRTLVLAEENWFHPQTN